MTWLYSRLGQLGTALLLLVIAMGAIWWGYSTWASGKTAKVENRINRETTEAVIDTVEVANAAAENVNKSADQIDGEVKELANEVLSAPAGQRNAAAVRAVCGMRAYRGRPECAGVRAPDPGEPAD